MSAYKRIPLFLVLVLVLSGCQKSDNETKTIPNQQSSNAEQASPEVEAVAMKAKDELVQRLSAKLMQAVASQGPASAIEVCSEAAIPLTKTIGEKHGVTLGRTSFHQRNRANKPPEWAASLVKDRVAVKTVVPLENGATGFLLPMFLQPQCMACHGPEDKIRDDVKTQLKKLYPQDQATGFKEGDLRGWIWIEVPVK